MEILVQDLDLSISQKSILSSIELLVKNKEFVGIIGPNGSGKSTLLKCIYRVLKPSTGIIALDGKNLANLSYKESALSMAVVAQHNTYNFDFSVIDVVLMGRSPHKKLLETDTLEDYAIARESLKKVGMLEFENRSFSTLSGGEQQRVILARALTQKTDCLILDEPTNHLDIKYQLQIMDIVKTLGLTVISAVHDLNIAASYCDRLVALKDGRIVGEGTPQALLTKEFIKYIYGVAAEVYVNQKTGLLNITYIPGYCS